MLAGNRMTFLNLEMVESFQVVAVNDGYAIRVIPFWKTDQPLVDVNVYATKEDATAALEGLAQMLISSKMRP